MWGCEWEQQKKQSKKADYKSKNLFKCAKRSIPGGVNSPVRAFKAVGGTPVFFEKAKGAYLFDVDGNKYIDYIMSWGPMLLGHGHKTVIKTIKKQVDKALTFGAPTELEVQLAEKIYFPAYPNAGRHGEHFHHFHGSNQQPWPQSLADRAHKEEQ